MQAACSVASVGGAAPKPGRSGPSLFSLPRFDFCLTPKDNGAAVKAHHSSALCGAPLWSGGAGQESELNVIRLPRCDVPRCGQCASDLDSADVGELSVSPEPLVAGNLALQRNLQSAKAVIREVFQDLESHCIEERAQYEETGAIPPRHKQNLWNTYTNKVRLQRFATESMDFLRHHADCRTQEMTIAQLRFLVLLQHFVSEDTNDFHRPEAQRKHQDVFEGVLTDSVNSQLVKDAHRSEFSVDGQCFSLEEFPQDADGNMDEERRELILKFQTEFVMALETFLLSYCQTRGLSQRGSKRLVQAVTTQMSQAGLANLDRGSQATRYFVGSHGLDQRTAYNLSTMYTPEYGECLKLVILCMKTGFCQYLEKDGLMRMSGVEFPKRCKPGSYLYQYATLRFAPGASSENSEGTVCTLIDALDEAHIVSCP